MKDNISDSQKLFEKTRECEHPDCIVCDPLNDSGLALSFQINSECEVAADFDCPENYQGYPGILHGGIISLLLDGAMTNCLFAKQIRAVTGELTVRYRHPVRTNCQATIVARVVKSSPPLHYLEAELSQGGVISARGRCKFMECPAEKISRKK